MCYFPSSCTARPCLFRGLDRAVALQCQPGLPTPFAGGRRFLQQAHRQPQSCLHRAAHHAVRRNWKPYAGQQLLQPMPVRPLATAGPPCSVMTRAMPGLRSSCAQHCPSCPAADTTGTSRRRCTSSTAGGSTPVWWWTSPLMPRCVDAPALSPLLARRSPSDHGW